MKKRKQALALSLAMTMALGLSAPGLSAAAAGSSSYSDVDPGASYAPAVQRLTEEGIMAGIGGGLFGPGVAVSRAQAITVLARMAGVDPVETAEFSDVVPGSWYAGYVGWASESGIVVGDGNGHFLPDALVTSEHLNLMLDRYAESIGRDIAFYDTGSDTVTRADLAQRLYLFFQDDIAEGDTPLDPRPSSTPQIIYDTETEYVYVTVPPEREETEPSVPSVVQLGDKGYIMGYEDNGIYAFKGIPYGTAERFMRAEPTERYGTASAPTNCLTNGAVSPQGGTSSESSKSFAAAAFMTPSDSDMFSIEDRCLNLNVWTDTLSENAGKPVLVFMHGGGTTEGSAVELKMYDGSYFADYTDVVFVSVNARLNYLGYSDLTAIGGESNLGLSDMILALEWVQDNISRFGGDPSNVTIMGQSGGGTKVSALASSPKALEEGLFERIVIASGFGASARTPEQTAQQAYQVADNVRSSGLFVDYLRANGNEIDGLLPATVELTVERQEEQQVEVPDANGVNPGEEGYIPTYETETVTVTDTEEREITAIDGSTTLAELEALAATASDGIVFTFLQNVDYDALGQFGLSTGTFTADGEYFDEAGALVVDGQLNETAQNYTYMIGSAWAEMGGRNSADAVLGNWSTSGSPDEAKSNLTPEEQRERMEAYLQGRVGGYEETEAAFEEAYPNHDFYDLRSLQNAGLDLATGSAARALNAKDGQVYSYLSAYTAPYFGGMTMTHTGDIAFFFHSIETAPYQVHGDEENAYQVADTMASALASFCEDGDPSIDGLAWEPFGSAEEANTMIFDVESRCVGRDFNAGLRALLERQ